MKSLKELASEVYEKREGDNSIEWERFILNVKEAVPKEMYEYISKENCRSYDTLRKPTEEFFYVTIEEFPTLIVRAAVVEQFTRSSIETGYSVDYFGSDKRKVTSTTLQVLFCLESDRDWTSDFEYVLAKAYRKLLEMESEPEEEVVGAKAKKPKKKIE